MLLKLGDFQFIWFDLKKTKTKRNKHISKTIKNFIKNLKNIDRINNVKVSVEFLSHQIQRKKIKQLIQKLYIVLQVLNYLQCCCNLSDEVDLPTHAQMWERNVGQGEMVKAIFIGRLRIYSSNLQLGLL